MPKQPAKPLATSRLIGRTWTFSDVGQVRLVDSDPDHWQEADREWAITRPPDSLNDHWRWKKLMFGKAERASILSATGGVLALWCSGAESPLALPSGDYYRLDLFEIAPQVRGRGFGVFVFSIIATRADELGCEGLVLGAMPGLERLYLSFGGRQELAFGWKTSSSLVPFLFDKKALTYLTELADDHLDEG
jgi:GNAT superfamily N-acetyltransferase